jgi:hypothetical protein
LTLLPAAALPARAQSLLGVTLTLGGGCTQGCVGSQNFSNAQSLIDALTTSGFKVINPAYTVTSIATADIDFRGVDLQMIYATSGTDLIFTVPELNYNRVFAQGATRGENEQDLEDFLRANGDNIVTRILGLTVANTPIDPVAGNPASLMSRMVESDYFLGTTVGPAPDPVAGSASGYDRTQNLVGLNARFGRFTADGLDSDVIDLPLTYVLPLQDPRYAINFDLPLTYVDSEGSASFGGSFGIGVRLPLLDNWTLTPALRAGAVASTDLGSAATVGGASLTSNYRFRYNDMQFSIGNSVSYIRTFPLEIEDTTLDYDQQNFVFRNGISIAGPLEYKLFGQSTTWEVSIVNTQFVGDPVYVGNYFDIAVSFGTVSSVNGFTWDSLRVGLTYTVATDADLMGLRLNFGYQF